MGEKPKIDLDRVMKLTREKMAGSEYAEDVEAGANMMSAMEQVGRLPSVGARTIKGLDDNVFDGMSGVVAKGMDLDGMREARDSKLIKRKK